MNFRYILLLIAVCLLPFSVISQEKSYERLGNLILESVRTSDTLLFKSLIIPEKAVWENFKKIYASKWTKEEAQQAQLDLPENYKKTVENDFMLKFSRMIAKAKQFNLNFNSVAFELSNENDRFDRQMGIVRVFGIIDHPKFKYFSFGMITYKGNYYLVDPRVDISEVNKFSERNFLNTVVMSSNSKGELQSVGTIKIASKKSDSEVFQCITNSLTLFGVEDTHISDNNVSPSYIKGSWQFPYRINDSEDYIGIISYDFEYTLLKGVLTYHYSNYVHDKDDSDYEAIGVLSLKYNDTIARVFSQNEFYEMLYDTELNLKLAIKRLKQSTEVCN